MDQYTSPKIWGPHFWFMLDTVAYNYPSNPTKQDGTYIKNFIYGLQYLLPCKKCRYTYSNHINKFPIDNSLDSREKLIEWVNFLKKMTNKVILDNRIRVMEQTFGDQNNKSLTNYQNAVTNNTMMGSNPNNFISNTLLNANSSIAINGINTQNVNNNTFDPNLLSINQGFTKINPIIEKKNNADNSNNSKIKDPKPRIRKIIIAKNENQSFTNTNPYPTNYEYFQNQNNFYGDNDILIANKPRPYITQENDIGVNKKQLPKQLKLTYKCNKCE